MNTQSTMERRASRDIAWKVAAGILALVVVGLLGYLLLGNQGEPVADTRTPAPNGASAPADAAPADPPTTTSSASSWGDRGCNGTGVSGTATAAISQATWQPFLSAAIPSSPTLGPGQTDKGLRRCFQHSPGGAVMAAANLALTPLSPNGRDVIENQWTAGPGRDEMREALSSWSGTTGEIVAYRISACDPTACNVSLIVFGSGTYASSQMPLVWQNGDWMMNGAERMPEPGTVPSIPAGYTAWSASS